MIDGDFGKRIGEVRGPDVKGIEQRGPRLFVVSYGCHRFTPDAAACRCGLLGRGWGIGRA